MDPFLLRLLVRDNPWLEHPECFLDESERYLPPEYVPRLVPPEVRGRLATPGRATLVVGPRQAGKSTWAWQELRELDAALLLVNCEEPLVRTWLTSPGLVLADLGEIFGARVRRLLLEEVQHLADAGLLVKGLVDRRTGLSVVVTGSASFHLGAKTRESLAGRAGYLTLYPFSLDEACQNLEGLPPAVSRLRRQERFERHLVAGGYPAAWCSPTPELVLSDLVTAFLLRDASDRFRIERPEAFRGLLRLAARQVGNLVNLSEWASLLGCSVPLVRRYLGILEDAHVLVLTPPYAGGRRRELTKAPKVHFLDTGLRNVLVGPLTPYAERADRGQLLEAWVFSEAFKARGPATLHHWRSTSGAEVDLVLVDPPRLLAIEVKAGGRRARVSRALRSFVESYRPEAVLLVSASGPASGEPEELTETGLPVTPLHLPARDVARHVGAWASPAAGPAALLVERGLDELRGASLGGLTDGQ